LEDAPKRRKEKEAGEEGEEEKKKRELYDRIEAGEEEKRESDASPVFSALPASNPASRGAGTMRAR
jgi:hypothetical protein